MVIFGSTRGDQPVAPTHCALTQQRLETGDPLIHIQGTPYVYGVKAEVFRTLTAEQRAEIEGRRPKPEAAVVETAEAQEATSAPKKGK